MNTKVVLFPGLRLAPRAPVAPQYDPSYLLGCTYLTILCLSTLGHHFNSLVLPFVQKVITMINGVIWHVRGA